MHIKSLEIIELSTQVDSVQRAAEVKEREMVMGTYK
jgi:hypothetical protein